MANDVLPCDVCWAIGIAWCSCGRTRVYHRRPVGTYNAAFDLWAGDDLPLADDRDVIRILCGDKRAVALDPAAFPAHLRHGIVRNVGRTHQTCAFVKTQSCVRPQNQRGGQIVTWRYAHLSPAQHIAAVQSLLDG